MKSSLIYVLATLLCASLAIAMEVPRARSNNLEKVAAWDTLNLSQSQGVKHRLLRRAVFADREARTVTILAESCGLAAQDIVEFGIVGETSDRSYEALFLTYARAIDIGDALEFIGLPRGKNVSSKAQRYWPSGERVSILVKPCGTTNSAPLPLENYILDRKAGTTLARKHFVYCGSPRVPNPNGTGTVCLADIEAPVSILSLYNEPQTLLDVPRISHQGEVYENYTANPETLLPAYKMVEITLVPEPRPNNKPRMRPIELKVVPTAGAVGMDFRYREAGGKEVHIKSLPDLLQRLMAVVDESCDPMVSLYLDDELPLERARDICQVIQKIEGEDGVRMEPPPEGQIYYKGFLPDDAWRDRSQRLRQPWELHVGRTSPTNTLPALHLVQILEDWSDPDKIDPVLTPVKHPLNSFDEMPEVMEQAGPGLPVLLVYAPRTAPIGTFMKGIRQVLDIYSTVYIFAEP